MKTETLERKGIKNANDEKNTFLLTSLQIIVSELVAREVYHKDPIGNLTYMQGDVDETGKALEKLLQGSRYYAGGLTITNGDNKYLINLSSASVLLEDLQKELKIDWDKTTYNFDAWGSKNGYKRKFPTGSLPKEYELNERNHVSLAEAFDSYEDLINSSEYNDAQNNYETAMKAKSIYEQNGETKDAKKLEKLASYYKQHADAWKCIAGIARQTDYTEVNKEKSIRNDLEKYREVLEAITMKEHEQLLYMSERTLLELFRSNNMDPVNDVNLAVTLKIVGDIKEETVLTWNEDHTNPTGSRPVTFDEYLAKEKKDLEEQRLRYNDEYLLKSGKVKSMSHRQRSRMYSDDARIGKQDRLIRFLIMNENEIKKLLQQ